jgi:hypothetical protein
MCSRPKVVNANIDIDMFSNVQNVPNSAGPIFRGIVIFTKEEIAIVAIVDRVNNSSFFLV